MCWKVLGYPKQSSNWEIRPKNQATEVKNSLWKRSWASECLINFALVPLLEVISRQNLEPGSPAFPSPVLRARGLHPFVRQ